MTADAKCRYREEFNLYVIRTRQKYASMHTITSPYLLTTNVQPGDEVVAVFDGEIRGHTVLHEDGPRQVPRYAEIRALSPINHEATADEERAWRTLPPAVRAAQDLAAQYLRACEATFHRPPYHAEPSEEGLRRYADDGTQSGGAFWLRDVPAAERPAALAAAAQDLAKRQQRARDKHLCWEVISHAGRSPMLGEDTLGGEPFPVLGRLWLEQLDFSADVGGGDRWRVAPVDLKRVDPLAERRSGRECLYARFLEGRWTLRDLPPSMEAAAGAAGVCFFLCGATGGDHEPVREALQLVQEGRGWKLSQG